jgi:hypothetical protein
MLFYTNWQLSNRSRFVHKVAVKLQSIRSYTNWQRLQVGACWWRCVIQKCLCVKQSLWLSVFCGCGISLVEHLFVGSFLTNLDKISFIFPQMFERSDILQNIITGMRSSLKLKIFMQQLPVVCFERSSQKSFWNWCWVIFPDVCDRFVEIITWSGKIKLLADR